MFTYDLLHNSGWIIDSGATQHMTFDKSNLSDYVEFKQQSFVNLQRTIVLYWLMLREHIVLLLTLESEIVFRR